MREAKAGRFAPRLAPIGDRALLHGHCHQKAFGAMGAVEGALRLIPDLEVETIESSCCGMVATFGYQAETIEVSLAMAELSLLPSIRKAAPDAIVVADGTSCRHQIKDGAGREAIHVARLLAASMAAARQHSPEHLNAHPEPAMPLSAKARHWRSAVESLGRVEARRQFTGLS
jgi:Fe-S oxidoreductase